MSIDIEGRLRDMDKTWQTTDANEAGAPLPDGDYQASVDRFDFIESKKAGELFLKTEFRVLEGDCQGRSTSALHTLENAERLGFTKAWLEDLGIDNVNPLTDLEDRLNGALDQVCSITVKSKVVGEKKYTNVYLNDVLQDVRVPKPEDNGSTPPPPSDDDIPF